LDEEARPWRHTSHAVLWLTKHRPIKRPRATTTLGFVELH
jgi:hypothetical protein